MLQFKFNLIYFANLKYFSIDEIATKFNITFCYWVSYFNCNINWKKFQFHSNFTFHKTFAWKLPSERFHKLRLNSSNKKACNLLFAVQRKKKEFSLDCYLLCGQIFAVISLFPSSWIFMWSESEPSRIFSDRKSSHTCDAIKINFLYRLSLMLSKEK